MVLVSNPKHDYEFYGMTPFSLFIYFLPSYKVLQIRHLQSLLSLRLRTRLTRYLHDLYLSSNPDLRYYRASNHLDGVDQYLTADVEAWANSLSGL